jgi:hypothetical protein
MPVPWWVCTAVGATRHRRRLLVTTVAQLILTHLLMHYEVQLSYINVRTVISWNNSVRILIWLYDVKPRHSQWRGRGGYVGGSVGVWKHLGYGVPELPPYYTSNWSGLSLDLVSHLHPRLLPLPRKPPGLSKGSVWTGWHFKARDSTAGGVYT